MPGVLAPVSYEPWRAVRVLSSQGNTPQLFRAPEIALKTYKTGVPVYLNGGFVDEANFGGAILVYGVSAEDGHNYAVSGVANDLADGAVPNQTSAQVIPMGARLRDGNMGVYAANGLTIFSSALKLGQTFTSALIGNTYGVTKDAPSGFWFIDTTVAAGNSQVAVIIGVDPSSPNDAVNGARVFFYFAQSKRVFQ